MKYHIIGTYSTYYIIPNIMMVVFTWSDCQKNQHRIESKKKHRLSVSPTSSWFMLEAEAEASVEAARSAAAASVSEANGGNEFYILGYFLNLKYALKYKLR